MAEQRDRVSVRLMNDKVQFLGISEDNPERPITFDYRPPLGDGQGYNGLELLLMSFAGCIATAVVYLLRKMGKTVSGLEVKARGVRTPPPNMKLEKIFVEFVVESADVEDADIQKAIQTAEQSLCPVWQMMKNNVEILPEYKMIRD